MLFANYNNQKIRATNDGPRLAVCPCCNSEVKAKTGSINVHHWAHSKLSDCPMLSNEMTQWHIDQQNQFNDHEIEIRDNKWPNNVADICILNPVPEIDYLVIEVQHSPISSETIQARKEAYRNLIWIVDMTKRQRRPKSFTNTVSSRHVIYYINGWYVNEYLGIKPDHESLREFAIRCFLNTRMYDSNNLRDDLKRIAKKIHNATLLKTLEFKEQVENLDFELECLLWKTISLKSKEEQATYPSYLLDHDISTLFSKDDLINDINIMYNTIMNEYSSKNYIKYTTEEFSKYKWSLDQLVKIETVMTGKRIYTPHYLSSYSSCIYTPMSYYLKVPYAEKETVKTDKKAKWDPDNKKWYINTDSSYISINNFLILFKYLDLQNLDIKDKS